MKKIILSCLIVSAAASVSFANIANPDLPGKRKTIDTSLSIRLDKDATEARLIIPKSQLKQLRAELEQLDGGTEDATAAAGAGISRTQTIVSGGLLSLALVFGGVWFARSGRTHSKSVIATAVVLACGSIVTFVYGNAGPPPEARTINGKMFTQAVHMYKGGWGKIKLEVSDSARTPELIVPDSPKTPAE